MKLIPLTNNQFAQVDDEDYDYLIQWSWRAEMRVNSYYAMRYQRLPKISKGNYGKIICLLMHRVIMNETNRKVYIDHRNHNGLINEKYNLRKCSHSQNVRNRRSSTGKTSKYLGVYLAHGKWHAAIGIGGKQIQLGEYDDEIQAAISYDNAAKLYHGEFANPNFKTNLLNLTN